MTGPAALSREIDVLETVQRALAVVGDRSDDARRKELVNLRRQLAAQIASVGAVADPVFAAGDPESYRIFRAKFSALRSATALHQASWPAVRLGEDARAYTASAMSVREANKDFIRWVRATIADLQDAPASQRT